MLQPKININFIFRKSSESFHSIEELFFNIQNGFSSEIEFKNIFLPFHNGIVRRIKNILFIRKKNAKINHITGDINYVAISLPKKNTILTIHDIGSVLYGSLFKRLIIRFLWFSIPLRRVKKITVVSEFSKNQLLSYFNIPEQKIAVIPNCISDKFEYIPKKFNSQKPLILIVGTKKNKNIERAFKAIAQIKSELVILGEISEQQIKILEKFKIEYKTYFNLNNDEVVEIYKKVDLLLFPSTYEGFGVPILEAQATGIPVITSNIEPMNNISGKGALLINPFDVEDIKNGVLKIISEEEVRNKIINLGLKNVKKYRSKEIALMYYNLYLDVLKNG